MKKMKKLISMLVAATMTLAMAAPSFAAGSGSITVENATKGQKYTAYQVFAATRGAEPTTGDDPAPISYMVTKKQKEWFEANGSNDIFNFSTRAVGENDPYEYYVTAANEDKVAEYLRKLVTKEETKENADGTEETVVVFDENAKFFKATGIFENREGVYIEKKDEEATSTSCTISGLGFGYYIVSSSLGSTVSLTSTNPDATILDKNQKGPSKDDKDGDGKWAVTLDADGKVVENSKNKYTSANYGEKVDFAIQYTVTNYKDDKAITNYIVTDILNKGMTYDLSKIKVWAMNTNDELVEVTGLASPTITEVKNDADVVTAHTFRITVPWKDKGYKSPGKLVVTYSATVDQNADITNDGVTNSAKLGYTVEGTTTPTEPSNLTDTVTTYFYALALKKIDPNGTGLAGARFTLRMNGSNKDVTVKQNDDGTYSFDEEGTDIIESVANSTIIIKGLKAGSYTFTETKAPDGYNKIETIDPVEAVATTEYKQTYSYKYDTDHNLVPMEITDTTTPLVALNEGIPVVNPVVVINEAGTMLPSTGGIGTTIFYAVGIILMAGAVFFVVRRKRA